MKELRDKKIVHNENIEALDSPPSWDGIIDLIEVAKGFVGVTGWLLNKAYRVDGEYVLSDNSTRASFSLEGLLAELKIINKNT